MVQSKSKSVITLLREESPRCKNRMQNRIIKAEEKKRKTQFRSDQEKEKKEKRPIE